MANKKRGFTLLELTIVLAVVAIMTTGIVTLCASVKGLSDRTQAVSTALNDIATVRKQTTMWLSYFDTADWTIAIGDGATSADDSTTSSTEDTTATRLTATHKTVASSTDSTQKLTCRLYIAYTSNKQCKLVCEYPKASDNLLDENYTSEVTVTEYEFTALRFVHFKEVKDDENVTWTEKGDSGNDITKSGKLAINGKTAYVCTVSYFDTDGNGSMHRKEVCFVVVTKTAREASA